MADLVPFSTGLAVRSIMNEKRKSTSPSAIQLKNWRMTISTKEILDIISRLEKDKLLTYDIMLDSLTIACIQYVIIVIELQKVLSQELKCLCSKSDHCPIGTKRTKHYGCESLTILLH